MNYFTVQCISDSACHLLNVPADVDLEKFKDLDDVILEAIDAATCHKLPAELVQLIVEFGSTNVLTPDQLRAMLRYLAPTYGRMSARLCYKGKWDCISFHSTCYNWHSYTITALLYRVNSVTYLRYASGTFSYHKLENQDEVQNNVHEDQRKWTLCTSQEWLATPFGGDINIYLLQPELLQGTGCGSGKPPD